MLKTREKITRNPFYVLGLSPDCSRADLEREGQKLLGMLKMSMKGSAVYTTPLGSFERTEDLVRLALAELRDPDRRLVHELWACGGSVDGEAGPVDGVRPDPIPSLGELRRIFGW